MAEVLRIVEKSTGEVVESIDVSHETPSGVRQLKVGIRTQMNHDEYRLEEA